MKTPDKVTKKYTYSVEDLKKLICADIGIDLHTDIRIDHKLRTISSGMDDRFDRQEFDGISVTVD